MNQPSGAGGLPGHGAGECGQANFTVTLTPASAQQVTVNFSTTDGTAKAGLDYTAVSERFGHLQSG